jgi:hypothetical protein
LEGRFELTRPNSAPICLTNARKAALSSPENVWAYTICFIGSIITIDITILVSNNVKIEGILSMSDFTP